MKGNDLNNVAIQFENVSDLITKIDEAIETTGYKRVEVSVDTYGLTQEELEELNDNEIF